MRNQHSASTGARCAAQSGNVADGGAADCTDADGTGRGHELSNLTVGYAAANCSTMIIRPPQHGHGSGEGSSAGSVSSASDAGAGTSRSLRQWASLLLRWPLAANP